MTQSCRHKECLKNVSYSMQLKYQHISQRSYNVRIYLCIIMAFEFFCSFTQVDVLVVWYISMVHYTTVFLYSKKCLNNTFLFCDSSKSRDSASTPPAQRNGSGGLGQLSVAPPVAGPSGPSPLTARRGKHTTNRVLGLCIFYLVYL